MSNFTPPSGYIAPPTDRYPFREGAGGNGIWLHMERLADFASKAKVIIELGTGTCCGSTHAFDLGLKAGMASEDVIGWFAVDVYDSLNGDWMPKAPYFHYIQGDSRSAQTRTKVLTCMQDRFGTGPMVGLEVNFRKFGIFNVPPIDILYIDTIHEYAFLKAELETWLPLISPATLVLFHDTYLGGSYNPMTNAIKEMVLGDGAPLAATHRFVEISQHCNGLSALKPIAAGKGAGTP